MMSASQANIVFRYCAVVLALVLTPLSARAQDASSAQSFIQTNVQNALTILQDGSLAADQRRERVHTLLSSMLDSQRIAVYTLGPSAANANPADLAAYTDAFREFMIANYDYGLRQYSGESLNVLGVTKHGPGDFVVSGVIIDPAGSANGKVPPEVDFRILYEDGKYFVVDANVKGVWLAEAQREGFQSFLKEHNGDVGALTAHLKDMTYSIRQTAAK
jgi:phospholipid transport system substrate-binding protein